MLTRLAVGVCFSHFRSFLFKLSVLAASAAAGSTAAGACLATDLCVVVPSACLLPSPKAGKRGVAFCNYGLYFRRRAAKKEGNLINDFDRPDGSAVGSRRPARITTA
jgi:hypothetical protein